MRILGIDFGGNRTGIAISDPMGWMAQGLEVVSGGMKAAAARITQIVSQYGAKKVVVGYPINMDGTSGFMAERADDFIAILKDHLGDGTVEIIRWDERLTSVEASRMMRASGEKPSSRATREKGRLDIVAAAILLQSYLDSMKRTDDGFSEGEQRERQ